MKNRIKYCDTLRFIAIISIIAIHVLVTYRYHYFDISNRKGFFLFTFLDSFTRTGVPIFFMLTGISMFSKKEEKYEEFLKKRVLKLIIAYFVAGIIYYIYNVLEKGIPFSKYEFLHEVTSGSVAYHLWYMPVIILIYVMIPFIKKIALHSNQEELKKMISVVFILTNVLMGISILLESRGYYLFQKFYFPHLIGYTNYLFLGYYLERYKVKINKKMIVLSALSILLMPVATIWISKNEINDFFLNSLSMLVIFPTCLIFLIFKKYETKLASKKLGSFLEKNVPCIFYMYLIHVLVLSIFEKKFLKPFLFQSFGRDILIIIGTLFIVTLLSFLLAKVWIIIKTFLQKKYEVITIVFIQSIIYLFIGIFTLIIGNLLFNPYQFIKLNLGLMLVAIVVIVGLFYVLLKFQNIIWKYKWINVIMIFCYIIFQIIIMNVFSVEPSWDFGRVYDIAKDYALGNFTRFDAPYLYMCDNNIAISVFFSIVFKIAVILGLKTQLFNIGMLINMFMIDLSLLYVYLFFKKINDKYSKPFFAMCLFFSPIVFYLPIFYTDTITLPFVIIPLYYIYQYLFHKKKKSYIITAGILLGIGGIMKPTVLIPFIAMAIYLFFKKYYMQIFQLLIIIGFIFLGHKIFIKLNFKPEGFEEIRIPKNHYVMIGLEGYGGFSQEGYEYTMKYVGEENKKKADNKRIKSRVQEMIQKNQILSFYNKKISHTWTDGTFYAHKKLKRYPKYPQYTKYIKSSKNNDVFYWMFSNAEWIILLILMLVGLYLCKFLSKELQDLQWILSLSILGLFFFLLIWETRSRYLVNYSPIFMIHAYLGLIALLSFCKDRKKLKKGTKFYKK